MRARQPAGAGRVHRGHADAARRVIVIVRRVRGVPIAPGCGRLLHRNHRSAVRRFARAAAPAIEHHPDLPLVEACGPAVASWMRAAHQCPLDIHNTRVGMNSSEFHESIGMVLTDATSGHSKDIDRSARHYLDTHGMAGCFCNHSKDPNATISWTLVSAEDAPLHALVPTIVSLRRIEAGEFVMLDYGVRYNMDAAHCQ